MKKICLLLISIYTLLWCGCTNHSKKKNVIENSKQQIDTNMSEKTKTSNDACVAISDEDSAKFNSKQVSVQGEIENHLTLTVDSLKKMEVATIENFVVVCQSGANMKENKTCKGVLLRNILDKAKIKQEGHKDRNFYIVARATDNYKATFSWAEIYNNPTGDHVYVIFEENGKPIKQQGDMILICTNDIKTGPRHVYWLKSIEINRVD